MEIQILNILYCSISHEFMILRDITHGRVRAGLPSVYHDSLFIFRRSTVTYHITIGIIGIFAPLVGTGGVFYTEMPLGSSAPFYT